MSELTSKRERDKSWTHMLTRQHTVKWEKSIIKGLALNDSKYITFLKGCKDNKPSSACQELSLWEDITKDTLGVIENLHMIVVYACAQPVTKAVDIHTQGQIVTYAICRNLVRDQGGLEWHSVCNRTPWYHCWQHCHWRECWIKDQNWTILKVTRKPVCNGVV